MERMICLDGVAVRVDADKVEVDLGGVGLLPADHHEDHVGCDCAHGEAWQPVMSYHDGTTVYLHPASEAGDAPLGYKVACPRPHRWHIAFIEEGTSRTARLWWEAVG